MENNEKITLVQDVLKNFGLSKDGAEELGAILSLEGDQFNIISNAILTELERQMSDTNEVMLIVQALKKQGINTDDIFSLYNRIINEFEDELKVDTLPKEKIDFVKRYIGIIANAIASCDIAAGRMVNVPIALVHKDAKIPQYAHADDAGMDVYAVEDVTINPGETKIVHTGIKVAIPKGYELQIRPRSGLSSKTKLRIANSPATIDSGYRGEIGIIVENIEPVIKDLTINNSQDKLEITSIEFGKPYNIFKGDRIAQLILSEVPHAVFYKVDSVDNLGNDRGGGFGSTGK